MLEGSQQEGQQEFNDTQPQPPHVLRVLALHGSTGSGQEFVARLGSYRAMLRENFQTRLHVVAMDAPFPNEGGFSWWLLPPGVRSFHALEYPGLEESAARVLEAYQQQQQQQEQQFDVILAHSQGAILTTAMLALGKFPYDPPKGYVLNGVAWPNPCAEQLQALRCTARVLLVTGQKDRINPPESQEKVQVALKQAGAQVDQIVHSGGHNIPMAREDLAVGKILEWIMNANS
jgi:predicted esterase